MKLLIATFVAAACSSQPLPKEPVDPCAQSEIDAEADACDQLIAFDCSASEHVFCDTRIWCEQHMSYLERTCLKTPSSK
jgi:hypothetical protein